LSHFLRLDAPLFLHALGLHDPLRDLLAGADLAHELGVSGAMEQELLHLDLIRRVPGRLRRELLEVRVDGGRVAAELLQFRERTRWRRAALAEEAAVRGHGRARPA
jgi:hypothetical protein